MGRYRLLGPGQPYWLAVTHTAAQVLKTSEDLKTGACCSTTAMTPPVRAALKKVPKAVTSKWAGMFQPQELMMAGSTAVAARFLWESKVSLSWTLVVEVDRSAVALERGRFIATPQDCYIASKLVGENGSVIGVDMTDEQLVVARDNAEGYCKDTLGYKASNMKFVKGFMEMLDTLVDPGTVDVIISNCVVNLSPDKEAVMRGAYHCLRDGGLVLH